MIGSRMVTVCVSDRVAERLESEQRRLEERILTETGMAVRVGIGRVIEYLFFGPDALPGAVVEESKQDRAASLERQILTLVERRPGISGNEVTQLLRGRRQSVYDALRALRNAGQIEKTSYAGGYRVRAAGGSAQ